MQTVGMITLFYNFSELFPDEIKKKKKVPLLLTDFLPNYWQAFWKALILYFLSPTYPSLAEGINREFVKTKTQIPFSNITDRLAEGLEQPPEITLESAHGQAMPAMHSPAPAKRWGFRHHSSGFGDSTDTCIGSP